MSKTFLFQAIQFRQTVLILENMEQIYFDFHHFEVIIYNVNRQAYFIWRFFFYSGQIALKRRLENVEQIYFDFHYFEFIIRYEYF